MTAGSEEAVSQAAEPHAATRRKVDSALVSLIAATAAIGLAEAFTITSLSLFLSNAVRAAPLMIGLFFAGRAIAEIIADLGLGVISDRMSDRRKLLAICAAISAVGALSYMFLRNYYLLFLASSILFGIGGLTFSQLFAYTREFAERRGHGVAFFNSALRSVTSAAWILGPPLGFFVLSTQSFTMLYGICVLLYLSAAALCRWGLPNAAKLSDSTAGFREAFRLINRRLALLLGAIVLLVITNLAYQINIALFITKSLGLPTAFPGVVIAVASTLEVGLMLLFGAIANRVGKWRLVVLATVCATVFFWAMPFAKTPLALLLLQIPNAAWTAVVLSLPVVILQDNLPGRPGAASAVYAASYKSGSFLAGTVAGVAVAVAGFTNLWWVCGALTLTATVLLLLGARK